MEVNSILKGGRLRIHHVKSEAVIEAWLFIVFMGFLIITRSSYHALFHTTAELFTCGVSLGLFLIALNTIRISENSFIVFLGIGYFFAGVLDMLHVFTYSGVSIIFDNGDQCMVVKFWIAARYMAALTLLGSTVLLFRNTKSLNVFPVFSVYFFASAGIILSIFWLRIFPECYVLGRGLTTFKIVSEYLISAVFLLVALLYFKLRGKMNRELFLYMECHLLSIAVSEILFTGFFSPYDWTNIWSHIIRVIAYFFLYKAIIETGMRRPYAVLFHRMDTELHITADRLEEEQKLRMMMEEMLLKNDQCYELVINNSSDAITVVSDHKVIFANDKAARILGVDSPADLLGHELLDFIHPKERDGARNQIPDQASVAEFPLRQEYRIVTLAGDAIEVEAISDYLTYRGKPSCISIIRDISPQRQISMLEANIKDNEKALNATKEYNKLLTEFFSNISHELKTPLNVILGAIQVLALPCSPELPAEYGIRLNKYLKVMKQNCYRLLRLVNNLIDLSKFESGYSKLNLNNQNIVSTIEDIVQSVADYMENQGLEIIFDTDAEEKIAAVDADKIERIVLNLLSNSMKFTDKGGRIVVAVSDGGDKVTISVKDTGIGIPKDKLKTILDRFAQVDKALTRNSQGSGIGLSLVKTIVEMHGGTIRISSVEGEGSEVLIELPVRIVEEEAENSITAPASKGSIERLSIEFSDIYSYD